MNRALVRRHFGHLVWDPEMIMAMFSLSEGSDTDKKVTCCRSTLRFFKTDLGLKAISNEPQELNK